MRFFSSPIFSCGFDAHKGKTANGELKNAAVVGSALVIGVAGMVVIHRSGWLG